MGEPQHFRFGQLSIAATKLLQNALDSKALGTNTARQATLRCTGGRVYLRRLSDETIPR